MVDLSKIVSGEDGYGIFYNAPGMDTFNYNDMGIISGSFNPLHYGHLTMAHWVERATELIPYFELSIINCDKDPLTLEETVKRGRQFESICRPLIVSRCPNFVQKSFCFPKATFIVGSDTISRIGMAKYYFDSPTERDVCINHIRLNGCKFIVLERNGLHLTDLDIPDCLRIICKEGQDYVSANISSTELRNRKV